MNVYKGAHKCPDCGDTRLYRDREMDRHGERSIYNKQIILCRDCRSEFPLDTMFEEEPTTYSLYPGYSEESVEEVIINLKKRLKGSGYTLIKE